MTTSFEYFSFVPQRSVSEARVTFIESDGATRLWVGDQGIFSCIHQGLLGVRSEAFHLDGDPICLHYRNIETFFCSMPTIFRQL